MIECRLTEDEIHQVERTRYETPCVTGNDAAKWRLTNPGAEHEPRIPERAVPDRPHDV